MPTTNSKSSKDKSCIHAPELIIGAILAMGVIRILDSQDALDKRTEQSVSTSCTDYQGERL
jgi:hypothetical protein